MMNLCLLCFFHLSLLFITSPTPTFALKKAYVVYMGAHSHGSEVSELDLLQVQESHFDLLGSFIGRDVAKEAIFYSYTRHINGFAAMLDDEEAFALSEHREVVSVFINKGTKLQTTRSWSFLGLEDNNGLISHESIWKKARFGEDSIIANLDTGVWPESESFSDEGIGQVPARWKGVCENVTSLHGVRCNRKLIGARYFNKGYLSYLKDHNITYTPVSPVFTPRDNDGHGTHTLSTAAGNFVPNASIFGFGNGTAKGGSPRARVAAYKVCWPTDDDSNCFDADILAAFDAAIADGVDIISVSLAGDLSQPFEDATAVGAFHAAMKGVHVVCSAGNRGGNFDVNNISPWQFTVGASTIDRDFVSFLHLGNHTRLRGKSLAPKSLPLGKFYPIISAGDAKLANASFHDALLCKRDTLDHNKVKGKILVCLATDFDNKNINKANHVALAGAVGMVLANKEDMMDLIDIEPHVLPTTHISYSDGIIVFSYINSTEFPVAYIAPTRTQLDIKSVPTVASFSSGGPNTIIPEILKPDIIAPGVNIIAAYTEANGPTDELFDKRRVKFNAMSGTSMSCPHVAGVIGLLRTLYPHWSPAAVKSAIMTTAATTNNIMKPIFSEFHFEASPLNYGSGHVQPNLAMDPGLVYDLKPEDYLHFLCSIGYNSSSIALISGRPYSCHNNLTATYFNYPSITVPHLNESITVSRVLKNVGPPATYKVSIESPPGTKAVVKPDVLTFSRIGEEQTFYLNLKKLKRASENYVDGQITWTDGTHNVRSPIVIFQV